MTFLLNFVHFEAIFAYSETILLILNLILLILKQKSPTDVVEDLLFTVPCRMWRPVPSKRKILFQTKKSSFED